MQSRPAHEPGGAPARDDFGESRAGRAAGRARVSEIIKRKSATLRRAVASAPKRLRVVVAGDVEGDRIVALLLPDADHVGRVEARRDVVEDASPALGCVAAAAERL
jgi:hypothetical protein